MQEDIKRWNEARRKPKTLGPYASAKRLAAVGLSVQSTSQCIDPEMRERTAIVLTCPVCGGTNNSLWGSNNLCHGEDPSVCFEVSHRLFCHKCKSTWGYVLSTNECGHTEIGASVVTQIGGSV